MSTEAVNTSKPSLAIFGATGGCALAALVRALQAGHDCSVLVRTPDKLTNLLHGRGISADIISKHLKIHSGNITDSAAVQTALINSDTGVRQQILFGVGAAPVLKANPLRPVTLDQPDICHVGMGSLLTALSNLREEFGSRFQPPLLTVISTTGLNATRDVPIAYIPLYHWLLKVPHVDKKIMEEKVETCEPGLLRGWVIIHPSLLTDGEAKGPLKVRAGYEGRKKTGSERWNDQEGMAVGYYTTREDTGDFVFEECFERGGGEWVGKKVTITC